MKPGSCLIVTFDGLRRDRATAALMPELAAFMAEGTDFVNSRSVFPSETRVAITSTVTGCTPREHGLVANQFSHPRAVADRLFQTARHEDLQAADHIGALADRISLGERLAAQDRCMAVVATSSPGASWMLNHQARRLGHPVYSMYGAPVTTQDMSAAAAERIGPVPEGGTPNSARIAHAARVLTEVIYPDHDPDLAVLWMNDPDLTAHHHGITAPQTSAAQAACDETFGRLLEWWRRGDGPENLIVMSDHGQITGLRHVDVAALLPEFRGHIAPGAFTGLYPEDASPAAVARLVSQLSELPECGLILTRPDPNDPAAGPAEGSFDMGLLGTGHARSPAVGFTLRATVSGEDMIDADDTDPDRDGALFCAGIPQLGGIHGGLHRGELSTVLAARGPAFGQRRRVETPCWLPDIAPTVLRIMGLDPAGCSGRVLAEGLSRPAAAPRVTPRRIDAQLGEHRQSLRQWVLEGGAVITDCGWSTRPDEIAAEMNPPLSRRAKT
ncbi:MAG: alkaline phosphatase family protein, partial [Celeribacter sp.]